MVELNNKYLSNNKEKLRAAQRVNHARRMKDDLAYNLRHVLHSRVLAAVKNKGVKCKRTVALVGCSIPELIIHLEKQFKEGMCWDNHSQLGWHIDHKLPCASFDLSKPEEQIKCFHYTNLQPLWGIDNIKKGARLNYAP